MERVRIPRKKLSRHQRELLDFYSWLKNMIVRDTLYYGVTHDPLKAVWILPNGVLANGTVSPYSKEREVDHTEYPHNEELHTLLTKIKKENNIDKETKLFNLFAHLGGLVRFAMTKDGSVFLTFYGKPTPQQLRTIRDIISMPEVENVFVDAMVLVDEKIDDDEHVKKYAVVRSEEMSPDEAVIMLPKILNVYDMMENT